MCKEKETGSRVASGSKPISDADRPHAVIRFKRDVQFPRFDMKAGERWSFVVFGKHAERLARIKAGERFDFAGGQCLAEDVELVYEGPCGLEYSVAAGYVPPRTLPADQVHHQREGA